jgi:hypothetical protein
MSETVTLSLPDSVAQSAQLEAARTNRTVEDVLLAWLDRAASQPSVEALSDEDVLALRDYEMEPEQQRELSDLLAVQREDSLDLTQRERLDALMRSYRQGMVLKTRALKVAVERGLQPPLASAG